MDPQDPSQPQPPRTSFRRRFNIRTELLLVLLPTATVLGTLFFLETFSRQQILFTSLASSAFLIYLDPEHMMNRVRTLVIAQPVALLIGYAAHLLVPGDYLAAGVGMVLSIVVMVLLDAVHPPAVSTSLLFAFHDYTETTLMLFGLALGMTLLLVGLEQVSVWLVRRYYRRFHRADSST